VQKYPIARDLVLAGAGHSHVIVLRKLGMQPVPGLQVTLVSPGVRTAYSGMLPGVVAGHYAEDDIHIDLEPLCRFAGARFIKSRVTHIDPGSQLVMCQGRPPLSFDVLSVDIGITPALQGIAGASQDGIPVKPINRFLEKWDAFLDRVAAGNVSSVGFVGAGAGGVELCLAVRHRLGQWTDRDIAFHLFSDKATILPGYPAGVGARFSEHLSRQDIAVHCDFAAVAYENRVLRSASGEEYRVDEAFFVTRAASRAWLRDTGLDLDENGFIKVRDTLQVTGHDNVFAAGDIAHVVSHPRPKAGVFAVRQGPPLYDNLLRVLHGKRARAFRPQQEFLSLITTGGRHAVASRNGISVEGRWVWRWKDWIDRRFMRRFSRLPKMKTEKFTGLLEGFDEQMQCGGCGSKVSADILREVLKELGVNAAGLDDAAVYRVPPGKVMLSSVDAFRAFIDDPWRFAQVAVNHALGDIYAMGGEPVAALAVVTLPRATATKTRELLRQLLSGALEKLGSEGVDLMGGHTSEGMEMSLGFTVNGIADEGRLLTKADMRDGDVLIVTRAIGTGALFAADMQAKAKGDWIDSALASMLLSNRGAMDILMAHQVRAATDVTGFGLAGHLSEMLEASHMAAILDLDALPVLPGALEVIAGGITSTLHEGNRRSVPGISLSAHENYEVLFDPQTSGGLLASVSAKEAPKVLAALREAGYPEAAIIGRVQASDDCRISFS
jgi:selenide,water dikinase